MAIHNHKSDKIRIHLEFIDQNKDHHSSFHIKFFF